MARGPAQTPLFPYTTLFRSSRNNQQFNGMAGPQACAEPSKGDNFERMTVFLGRSNHLSKRMASKRGIPFHGNILLSTAEKLLETPHFLLEPALLDEQFLASSHAPGRNPSRLFRGGRGGPSAPPGGAPLLRRGRGA